MEKQELTFQSEFDWPIISMDVIESTWKNVAWLIAELWKEGTIYFMEVNITEGKPEIIAQLIENFIREIQKRKEAYFIIDINITNGGYEKYYMELVKILKNDSYIDSHRVTQAKNSTEKHLQLICE